MNALVKRPITGTFNVVGQIMDDKLDELVKLLGLTEADKATLKDGAGLIVVGPIPENSPKS